MAKPGKKDPKAPKTEKATDGPGIMGLVRLAAFMLAIVSASVLCVSLLDLGFIDLREQLHAYAGGVALALLFFAVLSRLAGSRVAAAERGAAQARIEALKTELQELMTAEVEAKAGALGTTGAELSKKLAEIEDKVDKFLGAEHDRLVSENENYRNEIEQQRRDEIAKASEEMEALRVRNQELQEKINKWAVESVDTRLGQDKLHAA